jgi:hypothetical protein
LVQHQFPCQIRAVKRIDLKESFQRQRRICSSAQLVEPLRIGDRFRCLADALIAGSGNYKNRAAGGSLQLFEDSMEWVPPTGKEQTYRCPRI